MADQDLKSVSPAQSPRYFHDIGPILPPVTPSQIVLVFWTHLEFPNTCVFAHVVPFADFPPPALPTPNAHSQKSLSYEVFSCSIERIHCSLLFLSAKVGEYEGATFPSIPFVP